MGWSYTGYEVAQPARPAMARVARAVRRSVEEVVEVVVEAAWFMVWAPGDFHQGGTGG